MQLFFVLVLKTGSTMQNSAEGKAPHVQWTGKANKGNTGNERCGSDFVTVWSFTEWLR